MQINNLKRLVIVAAVTVATAAGVYASHENSTGLLQFATAVPARADSTSASPGLAHGNPDFSTIVSSYGPAVVNISVSGSVKTGNPISPFPGMDPGDPGYDFFRHFRLPMPQGEVPTHGLGSGFIVASNGIVLTNAHVVDGADEVTVKLTDKREFKAKVLGLDKTTDVAVLRINASELPTVRLGDPAQSKVGSWVLAIGSPFGFENSATAGIISAKSRSLDDGYVAFIQTDVAVNPGNSGGPLFNAEGEVIGINSQIYSRSGGYQGLSFAIPIDVAMKVQQQIVAHGKVEHGRLGVSVQDVDQGLADSFGLKKPAGALISAVNADSPAAKAKLQPGDIIVAVNDKEISRSSELPPLISGMQPGTSVSLKIWRKGEALDVKVALGDFNAGKLAAADESRATSQGRLGVGVRPLSPDEQRQAEVSGGLLVEEVSGPAARAGIQQGDVILALNGEPVASVAQLRAQVAKSGKHAALLVQRNDAKLFVPVELG
jgi:serine protease Do